MSSRKPEVHNISHCRQMRTEPWQLVTYAENLMKFGRVDGMVFRYASGHTNKQTDTLITRLREVKIG